MLKSEQNREEHLNGAQGSGRQRQTDGLTSSARRATKNKKGKKIKRNEKNVNMIEIFKSFTAEMFKPHFG